ncbi:MAG: Ig-like domain-containing protein, partial [Desulfovibrionales bacterium]|nr:Ig-like domain-containing protein [Desulfovibrionales bacterium]
TITASRSVSGNRTINFQVSDGDGNFLGNNFPTSVTLPSGRTSATVTIPTINDAVDEANGTVSLRLQGGNRYILGSTTSASVAVHDNDTIPALTISGVPDVINGRSPFTAIFSFSNVVTGFTVEDISLTNASASNLTSLTNRVFTAQITPNNNGNVTVSVAANRAVNAGGTGNSAAAAQTARLDATPPTVSISGFPTGAASSNSPFTLTFTFSEEVTGFAADDISLTNASASNFTTVTTGRVYTAQITPDDTGDVTVTVLAARAMDDVRNGNAAAVVHTVRLDAVPPAITITGVPETTNSRVPFTATFTFNEVVTGFTADDISLTHASLSNFATVTAGRVFTALITPNDGGDVAVAVAANRAFDGARNGNTVATTQSARLDIIPPSIAITGVPGTTSSRAPFTSTFTFSEAVTGFASEDISLTHAAISNFATVTPGRVFSALITPDDRGDVTVAVAANRAQDGASNGNTAAPVQTSRLDLVPPSITITGVPSVTNRRVPFTATFTFNEVVTEFTMEDISLTHAAASNFATVTPGLVFTALITPDNAGDVTVAVAEGLAFDAARNGNTASVRQWAELDNTRPVLTLDVPVRHVGKAFTVTFSFSEAVTGFELNDIVLTNGTAQGALEERTPGRLYALSILPQAATEDVEILVRAGAARDRVTIETEFVRQTVLAGTEVKSAVIRQLSAALDASSMDNAIKAIGGTLAMDGGESGLRQASFGSIDMVGDAGFSVSPEGKRRAVASNLAQVLMGFKDGDSDQVLRQMGEDISLNYAFGGGNSVAGSWTSWLRVNYNTLDGDPMVDGRQLNYEGDAAGFYLGLDRRLNSAIRLGMALGVEVSELDVKLDADDKDDQVKRRLPALFPYLDWQIDGASKARLILGYGRGELEVTSSMTGAQVDSDVDWMMAAVQADRTFKIHEFEASLEGNLRYAQSHTDAAGVDTLDIEKADAEVGEAGIGLRVGHTHAMAFGSLKPYASLKANQLFGDLDQDLAYHAGGGLELLLPKHGLTMRLDAEFQANRTEYERNSYSLEVNYNPATESTGFNAGFNTGYDTNDRQVTNVLRLGYRLPNWGSDINLTSTLKEASLGRIMLEFGTKW